MSSSFKRAQQANYIGKKRHSCLCFWESCIFQVPKQVYFNYQIESIVQLQEQMWPFVQVSEANPKQAPSWAVTQSLQTCQKGAQACSAQHVCHGPSDHSADSLSC